MVPGKLTLAAVAGVVVVAVSVGVVAGFIGKGNSAQAASSTQALREKYTAPTHVQLKPFMAPVQNGQGNAPITVFLESYDKDWIGTICRQNPRIRDAVLTELFEAPLPRQGRDDALQTLAAHLVAPINQALGYNLVKSVYIVNGAERMATGAVSRLPFNAAGCKGVKNFKAG